MWLLAVTGTLVGVSVLNSLYLQNAAGARVVAGLAALAARGHSVGPACRGG